MTMIDAVIILTKLKLIKRYLQKLKTFEAISVNDYLNDFDKQLIVERLLQLIIQAAIGINNHLFSRLTQSGSASHFEVFIELGKCDVITLELAEELTNSVGLRNHLIYEYYDIDPNQVFKAISFALHHYPVYVQQISNYLNLLEVNS